MKKVLLFNPRAAKSKPRIPNSVLQVAASIEGSHEWVIVDGNREEDPYKIIAEYLATGAFRFFCSTVMPGPQLKQAVQIAKAVKEKFPEIVHIWGGYFASNQYRAVIESGLVDYIIDGPGDRAFPQLLEAIENSRSLEGIRNLIYREGEKIIRSPKEDLINQDTLPALPYEKLNDFYSIGGYLGKTFLGTKTIAYHSSVGCPFTCSFCAVVPIYEARWKGKSAEGIFRDILFLKNTYGGNAIEFHDNNFFVSEKRTAKFSKLMLKENISWWGEGRIDTVDKYSDETLELMRDAGCKMIFFGAESGSDEVLAQMDKGGTQTAEQIKRFASRMKQFGIIPEYSFVLGLPGASPEAVSKQIDADINFIKEIKEINADTEIIIYMYSPVPTEGSELFKEVAGEGFRFPEKLEDWLEPEWENFDLRKNPMTPWLKPKMVDRIRNFETVLNGYYPTASDVKLSPFQKKMMRTLSGIRYRNDWFGFPYEIKILQKYWLKYRQPEIEGF